MDHAHKAAAILRKIAAEFPNKNSPRELRAKLALLTAAAALDDYGTELVAKEALANLYLKPKL